MPQYYVPLMPMIGQLRLASLRRYEGSDCYCLYTSLRFSYPPRDLDLRLCPNDQVGEDQAMRWHVEQSASWSQSAHWNQLGLDELGRQPRTVRGRWIEMRTKMHCGVCVAGQGQQHRDSKLEAGVAKALQSASTLQGLQWSSRWLCCVANHGSTMLPTGADSRTICQRRDQAWLKHPD